MRILVFCYLIVLNIFLNPYPVISQKNTNHVNDSNLVSFIGVGDIMLGTDYPSEKYLPPNKDCSGLLRHVTTYLKNADFTFGNLEGAMAGEVGIPKKCNNPEQCYVFRMPERFVSCIVENGFNMISVANNHSNDFGAPGRKNTAKVLDEAGIPFAGFIDSPSTIIEKNGLKIGFAAFSPHSGTNNSKNIASAKQIIVALENECDVVVVSVHGGAEGAKHQHVPRTDEIFLGFNRGSIYEFSHAMIDAGADIIFGHGPHVTRALEMYKGRIIAYSLGNFCTYARFNLSGPNGIAPILKIYTTKQGEFVKGEVVPVYQSGEGGPRYDPQKRAIQKLIELSKQDFPESKLIINENGFITYSQN